MWIIISFLLFGPVIGNRIKKPIGRFLFNNYYVFPNHFMVFVITVGYSSLIAFFVRILIHHYSENLVLNILCYGAGGYISYIFYPNRDGDPFIKQVNTWSLLAYILSCITVYFLIPNA